MINDPTTLYKLMILHMLNQVNFPLTESQISDFFLNHEYTNYFTLKTALSELVETKLIFVETIHNTSRYSINQEGRDALEFFDKKIPSGISEDIDNYLKENKFRMRNEIANTADYYKSTNQDFVVHCEVREGKTILISFDISVPDENTASHMCNQWKNKSSEIYGFIMKSLTSE